MGRNLKHIFTSSDQREEFWEGLEFGDLIAGDKYISLPIPGNNNILGSGFRNSYSLFQKIQSVIQNGCTYNCVQLKRGRLIYTPDDMPIIKIDE